MNDNPTLTTLYDLVTAAEDAMAYEAQQAAETDTPTAQPATVEPED